jgi:glycosyltransferase involved in cell wall biosynthesis
MKFLIITSTLRIGGIERNTLDQAYQLSDRGDTGIILVLDYANNFERVNFTTVEKDLISNKKLDIRYSNKGTINQISNMIRILKEIDFDVVIDYTISGTLKVRLASLFAKKRIIIHTVVQQLTSLSTTKQKYQRFFYAQFATRLFMNSINYGNDWVYYGKSNLITFLISRKKFSIIRNGVYLPRLKVSYEGVHRQKSADIRLVFLGRLKTWKGLDNFVKIDNALDNKVNFLVLASENIDEVTNYLKSIFGNRIEFIFGTTINDFVPSDGDIHFYPVDYGNKSPAIESVSTNCLEMALLGVPSVVTIGGTSNWIELKELGLVYEVDWEIPESIRLGIKDCKQINISRVDFTSLANAINIESNLNSHLSYL